MTPSSLLWGVMTWFMANLLSVLVVLAMVTVFLATRAGPRVRPVVQLPYPVLLMLGRGLGALMYRLVGSRREIAARNLELCFPEKSPAERERLLKEKDRKSVV